MSAGRGASARIVPVAATDEWLTVMERAGYRCQCTRCPRHRRQAGGRCETEVPITRGAGVFRQEDVARLVAGPRDPGPDPARAFAAAAESADLVAWCPPCWDRAVAQARRHARELARIEHAETPGLW